MPNKPIIHVISYAQLNTLEHHVLMPVYHLDRDGGALAMPRSFRNLGEFEDRVDHYEPWLRNQINRKEIPVQVAMENIYDRAINGGIIIATLAQVVPFYTHAHVLRDIILELAEGDPHATSQEDP
jgi:hypothetical protein